LAKKSTKKFSYNFIFNWIGKSQSDFELNFNKSHIDFELNFNESQNASELNNPIIDSYHVHFIIC
jgi:hypothetical protein